MFANPSIDLSEADEVYISPQLQHGGMTQQRTPSNICRRGTGQRIGQGPLLRHVGVLTLRLIKFGMQCVCVAVFVRAYYSVHITRLRGRMFRYMSAPVHTARIRTIYVDWQ